MTLLTNNKVEMKKYLSKIEVQILEILKVFGELSAKDIAVLSGNSSVAITVECIYMYSACLIGRTHPDRPKEILYSITEIGEETLTL